MVWIMLAITMVCVVIVFAIVMVQKEKGTLVKQARAVTKDMVYENAYIVSNDDGRLIFICDGELYRAKGTMEESFTGVCDIEISGSKVKKIQVKPDDISGVMLSYGNGTMQIAGQGDIPMQSDKLPVYDETGTSPKEISVSDLIIGSETLSYILGFCVYSSAASLYLLSDILPAVSITLSSRSAAQSGAHILG